MMLCSETLRPGEKVSCDQYVSAVPSRLPHTKGKEPKKDKYNGGTLFVDHATGFVFLRSQVSLRTGETLRSKAAFEQDAKEHGITITNYLADNAPFGSNKFKADLTLKNQKIEYSGIGAHHQNGVVERAIMTITRWARAMLLHAIIHWPDKADVSLWPFALEYTVYIWNHTPRQDSKLAPIKMWTSSAFPSYSHLNQLHIWGCPVYVLDPT
jgi:hypothetical protein